MFKKLSVFIITLFVFLSFYKDVNACNSASASPSSPTQGESVTVSPSGCQAGQINYSVWVTSPGGSRTAYGTLGIDDEGIQQPISIGSFNAVGSYTVEIQLGTNVQASTTFTVTENEDQDIPGGVSFYTCGQTVPFGTPTCSETITTSCCPGFCAASADDTGGYYCKPDSNARLPICAADSSDGGFPTAIGCIPFSTNEFVITAITYLGTIAGGIAFLIIVVAAFIYMTSQANPNNVGTASEMFKAAITGLLLIVLGIIVFRTVAVDILGLF